MTVRHNPPPPDGVEKPPPPAKSGEITKMIWGGGERRETP